MANTPGKGYFVVYYDDILAGTFNISVDGDSAYWGCALHPDARNIPGLFIGLVLLSGRIAFENMALQSIRSEVLDHNTAPIKVNSYLKIPVTGKEPLEGADREQGYAIQYRLDLEAWPDVKKRAERLMSKTMFSAALSCSTRLDA
ncbi:hypothetical protein [uncultured Nitratireductor sp.]|uniref:hypothetical protein n=1 Tax=uncultured Nitratireductor sp. TaxID=520953 RepID=UPI0025EA3B31|nr:hypothetical protein [uncultured Nitratireductor sp.]